MRDAIGDMLPVYLDHNDGGPGEPPGPVQFQLAREGWLQAWARLRDNESDERSRLESMRKFEVLNRVRGLKPGASVIATVRDDKGAEIPALVVQRFGRGRTASLMIGDFWRWGMTDTAARADMERAIDMGVNGLITDYPDRAREVLAAKGVPLP